VRSDAPPRRYRLHVPAVGTVARRLERFAGRVREGLAGGCASLEFCQPLLSLEEPER
jgi:hypothetical protein